MQSKEKVLAKMVREGLTEKVEADRVVRFRFENVGKLPPPVLQVGVGAFSVVLIVGLFCYGGGRCFLLMEVAVRQGRRRQVQRLLA